MTGQYILWYHFIHFYFCPARIAKAMLLRTIRIYRHYTVLHIQKTGTKVKKPTTAESWWKIDCLAALIYYLWSLALAFPPCHLRLQFSWISRRYVVARLLKKKIRCCVHFSCTSSFLGFFYRLLLFCTKLIVRPNNNIPQRKWASSELGARPNWTLVTFSSAHFSRAQIDSSLFLYVIPCKWPLMNQASKQVKDPFWVMMMARWRGHWRRRLRSRNELCPLFIQLVGPIKLASQMSYYSYLKFAGLRTKNGRKAGMMLDEGFSNFFLSPSNLAKEKTRDETKSRKLIDIFCQRRGKFLQRHTLKEVKPWESVLGGSRRVLRVQQWQLEGHWTPLETPWIVMGSPGGANAR